ncbi:MAG: FecR domain-containing protein, partial [Lachnospiraceae bacterium]|nr:FecR domain-containing protein [Lachnospiraceae bacterium]
MMQKLITDKKIIICACAAAVVAVVAVIALIFNNKEETFRSIMVYDVEGNAVIERENVGAMNAAENLYLESGDRVSVASDSSMRMKLDDDKYVMAEADTVFSVEAEGTEADSKTRISLEQGAITNEIQHPLSAGSQYETSTPNSVMAVRGTIYRAELYLDETGGQSTKLCCFQGKVGAKPILPDGTYGEEILVPAGSELTVYQDGTVGDVMDIAFDGLPQQAVVYLLELMESGQDVTGISVEELRQLVSVMEDGSEASGSEDGQRPQIKADQAETEEETLSEAEREADAQIHMDMAKNTSEKPSKAQPQAPVIQPTAGKPAPQVPTIRPPKAAGQQDSASADNGNAGGEGSQDENTGNNPEDGKSDKDKPGKPNKPNKPNKPGKPNEPDEPDKPDEPDEPGKPGEPDQPAKPGEP